MYQLRVSTAGPADGLIGAATYQHLMGTLASGNCDRNLYRNYFERSIASNTASINEIRMQLNAVANSGPPIANAGTFDSAMRAKIAAVRSALAQPAGDELTPPLAARLRSLPP
jgi:hypothetical protein